MGTNPPAAGVQGRCTARPDAAALITEVTLWTRRAQRPQTRSTVRLRRTDSGFSGSMWNKTSLVATFDCLTLGSRPLVRQQLGLLQAARRRPPPIGRGSGQLRTRATSLSSARGERRAALNSSEGARKCGCSVPSRDAVPAQLVRTAARLRKAAVRRTPESAGLPIDGRRLRRYRFRGGQRRCQSRSTHHQKQSPKG